MGEGIGASWAALNRFSFMSGGRRLNSSAAVVRVSTTRDHLRLPSRGIIIVTLRRVARNLQYKAEPLVFCTRASRDARDFD